MHTRSWTATKNCVLSNEDKTAIRGLTLVHHGAAQILLTGCLDKARVDESVVAAYEYANSTVAEPLFIGDSLGYHMARFDPKEVWLVFGSAILEGMIEAEAKYLGVKIPFLVHWDFYESLVESMELWDTRVFAEGISEQDRFAMDGMTVFRKATFPRNRPDWWRSFFSAIHLNMKPNQLSARNKAQDKTIEELSTGESIFLALGSESVK